MANNILQTQTVLYDFIVDFWVSITSLLPDRSGNNNKSILFKLI